MGNRVLTPNLANGNINFSDVDFSPDVDEGIKRTISYLMGYDYTTQDFKLLAVDENGYIANDANSGNSTSFSTSVITVLVTATVIATLNTDRESIRIKNVSGSIIYIGYDSGLTTANGYTLNSDDELILDNYVGTIYGISAIGSLPINVLELL